MEDFDHVSDEMLDCQKYCNEVVNELRDVQEDWYKLGTKLDVLPTTLSRILHIPAPDGDHFKHLRELILAWLKRERREDHPSWRQLCKALYAMKKWDLADNLAHKHTIPIPSSSSVSAKNLTLEETDGVEDGKQENKHGHIKHENASVQQQEFELVCTNEICNDNSIPSQTIRSQKPDEQGWVERDESKGGGDGKGKRYLAITIANSYLNTDKSLKGVEHDYEQLCNTFDMPSVSHIKGRNVSLGHLNKILNETKAAIKESSDAQQPYEIAFVFFSGHGGTINQNTTFILAENYRANQKLPKVVLNSVFDCFLQIIGDTVPIFFIIDACRDIVEDAPKGYNQSAHSYLIGFATANGTESWSNDMRGSYWLQAVLKGLRMQEKKPVVDVLEEAKKEVIKEKPIQVPEIVDRNLKEEHKKVQLNIEYPVEEAANGGFLHRFRSLFDRQKDSGTASTCCQNYWHTCIWASAVIFLIIGVLMVTSKIPYNHQDHQQTDPPTDPVMTKNLPDHPQTDPSLTDPVDPAQEVLSVLLGVSSPEQLTTGCKSRQLNPSISHEPRNVPNNDLYQTSKPRAVKYDPDSYIKWKGLKTKLKWKCTVTDVLTGITFKTKDWNSEDGAKEHAYEGLVQRLKELDQKSRLEKEKLISDSKARIEFIIQQPKYKSARGILFYIEMSDSCEVKLMDKQRIQEKLGFAIYTITDPTSDDMSLLVKAAARIQYPSQYEYIVFQYSGQGGINELNQLFIKPFKKKTENEQILMDRDIIVPLKDITALTRLFLFNCCTSLYDHDSMSTANTTGGELITFTMKQNQSIITHPYCYICD